MADPLSLGEQARVLLLQLHLTYAHLYPSSSLDHLTAEQALHALQQVLSELLHGDSTRTRCEQFESMLQKSEEEVRAHIRIEQQLKLQLENLHWKIEAAKQTETEEFKLGKPVKRFASMGDGLEMTGKLDSKASKLTELASKRQKAVLALESECGALSTALEQKRTQLAAAKKDYERAAREAQFCQLYSSRELLKKGEPRSKRSDETPPLTERLVPLKGHLEQRKGSFSPYRSLGKVKSLSKIRADGLLDLMKVQGRFGSSHRV